MNRSKRVEFYHIEMTSQTGTALDQLDYAIATAFYSIRKFEPFDRYTSLQWLYTSLDHQLQDRLMGQHESDRMWFVVRKLWDMKLQIHMIEKEDTQLTDVIGDNITLHLEGIITRSLFVYVCAHLYTR